MVKAQRVSKKGEIVKSRWQIWQCAHKTKECLYHTAVTNNTRCDFKEKKSTSRDVIMEETHMNEKMRLKMMN